MKRYTYFFFFFFISVLKVYSQVGINTEDPTAMFDVNGDIRVRLIKHAPTTTKKILVADTNGRIYSDSTLYKTSFVKGTINTNSTSLISLNGMAGWNKINFDQVTIDENKEFTTGEFVAKNKGIYAVYAQYTGSSLVSVSGIGIGVLVKRAGTDSYIVDAQETFTSISLLGINVSPPIRKIFSLVVLDKGDTVALGASGLSLTIQLLGGVNSYFTIFQVK